MQNAVMLRMLNRMNVPRPAPTPIAVTLTVEVAGCSAAVALSTASDSMFVVDGDVVANTSFVVDVSLALSSELPMSDTFEVFGCIDRVVEVRCCVVDVELKVDEDVVLEFALIQK